MPGSPLRLPRIVVAVVLTVAVAGTLGPATAEETPEDLRRQREENRRAAAEVAAALDELGAEDQELQNAIEALDANIAFQEARIAEAEAAIADAELRAAEAEAEAEGLADEIDVIRMRLRARAVEMFVAPDLDVLEQLDADDLLRHEIRQSYAGEVAGDDGDLIDALRAAEADRDDARRRAEQAAADADGERAALAAHRDELAANRTEAETLRAEVGVRIADFEAVGREMAAADAAITEEIRRLEEELARQAAAEEEARRAAEEEEARRAAEEAAAAEAAEAAEATTEAGEAEAGEEAPSEGETDDPVDAPEPPAGTFRVTHRPVSGSVTSGFGPRTHPIFGTTRTHWGVDFDGSAGEPISAAAAGVVLTSGWMNGYGNTVVVSHGNGYSTLYAHQSSIAVSTGDTVSGGEVIGYVGSTGWSTGPHLHFEVRVAGTAVDPGPYL